MVLSTRVPEIESDEERGKERSQSKEKGIAWQEGSVQNIVPLFFYRHGVFIKVRFNFILVIIIMINTTQPR